MRNNYWGLNNYYVTFNWKLPWVSTFFASVWKRHFFLPYMSCNFIGSTRICYSKWVVPEKICISPMEELGNARLPLDIPGQPNLPPPLPRQQSPKLYPLEHWLVFTASCNQRLGSSMSGNNFFWKHDNFNPLDKLYPHFPSPPFGRPK